MVKSPRITVFPFRLAAWHRAMATTQLTPTFAFSGMRSSGFSVWIAQRGARSRSSAQRGARRVEAGVEGTQKGVLRWR
jgi:hypothetical protein